jgi:hypothetical protein
MPKPSATYVLLETQTATDGQGNTYGPGSTITQSYDLIPLEGGGELFPAGSIGQIRGPSTYQIDGVDVLGPVTIVEAAPAWRPDEDPEPVTTGFQCACGRPFRRVPAMRPSDRPGFRDLEQTDEDGDQRFGVVAIHTDYYPSVEVVCGTCASKVEKFLQRLWDTYKDPADA